MAIKKTTFGAFVPEREYLTIRNLALAAVSGIEKGIINSAFIIEYVGEFLMRGAETRLSPVILLHSIRFPPTRGSHKRAELRNTHLYR